LNDADDHALAVDVANLEAHHFGAAHARAVHRHQQRAPKQVAAGIDEARDLLDTQDGGQTLWFFGIWNTSG
jgi:hypothetical protein